MFMLKLIKMKFGVDWKIDQRSKNRRIKLKYENEREENKKVKKYK